MNDNKVMQKELNICEEDKRRHLDINSKEKQELESEIEHLNEMKSQLVNLNSE